MNHQYRKKPVVVEAFQLTKERQFDQTEWPHWISSAMKRDPGVGAIWIDDTDGKTFTLGTEEGPVQRTWGAWIVQTPDGSLRSYRADVFAETYDKFPHFEPRYGQRVEPMSDFEVTSRLGELRALVHDLEGQPSTGHGSSVKVKAWDALEKTLAYAIRRVEPDPQV